MIPKRIYLLSPIVLGLYLLFNSGSLSCQKKSGTATAIDKDSISFIVIGDWGKDGIPIQKKVARQMTVYARRFNAKFVISTGDNFYPSGVRDISDPHWQTSYENIYNKDSLPLKWFVVLGNHDYGINPQAEVDYTQSNGRWNMLARYYTIKKSINGADSILFVFTDTSPFVSSYHSAQPAMSDLNQQDTAAQINWLSTTLRSSGDRWKIVVGHHPVYSDGPHGNTVELVQRFQPLLIRGNANFYLAGHDH